MNVFCENLCETLFKVEHIINTILTRSMHCIYNTFRYHILDLYIFPETQIQWTHIVNNEYNYNPPIKTYMNFNVRYKKTAI